MTIDWITVSAQLINFLVLVWLLKRFLYRPIIDGIDARESEIAERMGEASRIRDSAQSTVADFQQQQLTLQQELAGTREQAHQQATAERDSLLKEARERIHEEQLAARQQQRRQTEEYVTQLHQIAARAMLSVIGKALHELSDETLEERLALHALASLQEPSTMENAAASQPSGIILTTCGALDDATRQRIRESVEHYWPECTLDFTTDEQQSPGALVQFGSSQVVWTVDAYVKELESNLQTYLDSVKPGNKSAPGENRETGSIVETESVHEDGEIEP